MRPAAVFWLILAVAVALAAYVWMRGAGPGAASDTIEYQGQRIKLSRPYATFEEYKDDPDNIAPSENARVERLASEAPIGSSYPSRKAMVDAAFAIKFPGYGLSGPEEKRQPDGSTLALIVIEIPRAGKDRCLVFRRRGDTYALIDDFVELEAKGIDEVRDEGGQLAYYNRAGVKILSRHPRQGPG